MVSKLLLVAFVTSALAQVPLYGQCGGANWAGETACVSGACCTFSNDYYSQCTPCAGGSSSPTRATTTRITSTTLRSTTTTRTSAPPVSQPTGVITTLPASSGVSSAAAAITVGSSFDGGMKRFERSSNVCQGQTETGEEDAMFILEPGASLSNVIIGASQAEGVHCRGTCALTNVWWAKVCEDAATFKHSSGTSYVIGGGAWGADDKIFQFNGRGTVNVKNFFASDYGKVSRSCGDCTDNGGPRNFVFDNVVAKDGGVLCGINTNYGDTCKISNSCQSSGKYCDRYKGVEKGDGDSEKIDSGPDGTYCTTSNVRTSC